VGALARAFARVALIIQHATCMRHIARFLSGCTVFFRRFLINDTIFGKELLKVKACFDFLYRLGLKTFLILRRIWRDIIINVKKSLCKVFLNSCRIVRKLKFPRKILQKERLKYQIFFKIRPVRAVVEPHGQV
jgi:hypothetical protein